MSEPRLGAVIVTYNSGAEAVDCAETLLGAARAAGLGLCVAVVDNASRDGTLAHLRAWARGEIPYAAPDDLPFAVDPVAKPLALQEAAPGDAPVAGTDLMLIASGANRGYAGGVNVGLASLAACTTIDHFWVLNPDSVVAPAAGTALAAALADPAPYALMGGRVIYLRKPDRIQIDGGTIDWRTGVTGNLNRGRRHAETPLPHPSEMDFIMGGCMIASRAFYRRAGPMREDYFLYYEEVDWALRRGDLPLAVCDGLHVYHRAGSAIGSPGGGRPVSPMSLYFKHRGRMMFLRRFRRRAVPAGHLYTLAIAARLAMRRRLPQARAALAGGFGLPPPAAVATRLGPEVVARLRGAAGPSG